mgnify:FL=1
MLSERKSIQLSVSIPRSVLIFSQLISDLLNW